MNETGCVSSIWTKLVMDSIQIANEEIRAVCAQHDHAVITIRTYSHIHPIPA